MALPPAGPADLCAVTKQHLSSLNGKGFLLHNVLPHSECRHFMRQGDANGFENAIEVCSEPRYRNAERLVFISAEFASVIMSRIRDHLPPEVVVDKADELITAQGYGTHGIWKLDSLNPCFRLCRYQPGGHFAPHYDGNYVAEPNVRSFYTVNLYLNGLESFTGGSTNFLKDDQELQIDPLSGLYQGARSNILESVRPEPGLALVFLHPMMHEGEPTAGGLKYILRTDVMYRREEAQNANINTNDAEALRLFQEASDLERDEPFRAAMMYKRAFKLSPALAAAYKS